ncbi:MAG TPA: hypothetical protein VNP92_24635 [Actinophytocola sp.]|nr:hypothetical protein [Actinophytocola sp.]
MRVARRPRLTPGREREYELVHAEFSAEQDIAPRAASVSSWLTRCDGWATQCA